MKNLYLRSCVALMCATSLAACGGGSGSLIIGGTISGLTKTGLTLTNNNGPELAIASGATGFSFPNLIATDANYDVQIKTQPAGAVCKVVAGTNAGRASFNITSVQISCVTNAYTLSGVAGVGAAGKVLITGNNQSTVGQDGKFAFPTKIADGASYGIVVQNCTVQGGSGTMGSADVAVNITVTCP